MEPNLDKAFRPAELIVKYLQNELADDESQELDSWTEESEDHRNLFYELTDPELLHQDLLEFERIDAGKKAAWRRIKRQTFMRKMVFFGLVPLVVLRYVAAAALLGVIATGIYFVSKQSKLNKPYATTTTNNATDIRVGDDNPVVLTLSDGSTVALDSSKMGLLAQQGGVNVLKQQDNQIVYDAGTSGSGPVSYNSIQTPRGKTYKVVLPDGSKVTLNALTKLEYPTAFTAGKNRNITLTEGEAYFQVVADRSKPFQVDVAGMNITVTGTEFNINAYKNEAAVKSTLFEGGIKVTSTKDNTLEFELRPGQQLVYDSAVKGYKMVNADLEATSAWRDNLFNLDNADVPTLMREISRWYDVDVIYSNGIPKGHFEGQIPRNMDFADLLKVLHEGGIKTKLDGRKLVIL